MSKTVYAQPFTRLFPKMELINHHWGTKPDGKGKSPVHMIFPCFVAIEVWNGQGYFINGRDYRWFYMWVKPWQLRPWMDFING